MDATGGKYSYMSLVIVVSWDIEDILSRLFVWFASVDNGDDSSCVSSTIHSRRLEVWS